MSHETRSESDLRATDERIARGSGRQKGLATTKQLVRAGLTNDMIRQRAGRTLHRIHHGVWAVGHPNLPPGGRELAAALACGSAEGSGAVVVDRDATVVHELLRSKPGPVHIATPTNRRSRPGMATHQRDIPPRERTTVDGVPVTTIDRTLIDFSRVASARELERAVNEALARRKTTHARLTAAAFTHRAPRLRVLLGAQRPGRTRSGGERRLARRLVAAGVELELVNELILGERVDFAWPSARLVVEVDEHATHGTRERFEDDHRQDMKLRAGGWEPRRFTTDQVDHEGDAVVGSISAEIAARRLQLRARGGPPGS